MLEEEKFKLNKEERDAMLAYIASCASKAETMIWVYWTAFIITGINLALVVVQILLLLLR